MESLINTKELKETNVNKLSNNYSKKQKEEKGIRKLPFAVRLFSVFLSLAIVVAFAPNMAFAIQTQQKAEKTQQSAKAWQENTEKDKDTQNKLFDDEKSKLLTQDNKNEMSLNNNDTDKTSEDIAILEQIQQSEVDLQSSNSVGLSATPASDFEYTIESDGVHIKKYTGSSANVIVPAKIEEKDVVYISTGGYPSTIQISSLNISKCKNLKTIICSFQYKLKSLDVSKNIKLQKLICMENHNVKKIDVSHNLELESLNCADCPIDSLDVTNNKKLKTLCCGNVQTDSHYEFSPLWSDIKSINLSCNTELESFQCWSCKKLKKLDLSNNTKLTTLNIQGNSSLTSLILPNKSYNLLNDLICSYNNLSSLDVSKNTNLTRLDCGLNNLSFLDLSKNTKLESLRCDNNILASLDISKNTKLKTLNCAYNNIQNISKLENWLNQDGHSGTISPQYKQKIANPIKLKSTSKSLYYSTTAQSFTITYATKSPTKVTYVLSSAAKSAGIKVSTAGKVTIPAKCKVGTYKITVKAASNAYYAAKNTTFTLTIKDNPSVYYRTHVQNVGWQKYVKNGAMSGTSGKSLRLEGINIKLGEITGDIQYRTHIQNIGWEKTWKKNGAMSGTSGKGLRLEGIQIKLTGDAAKKYDVYYCVHIQNIGWGGWAKNGAYAGSAGYSYRLEGIKIVLVKKGGTAPKPIGSTTKAFFQR